MVENQVTNPVTVEQNISKPIHYEVADKETESPNTPLNTPRRCQLLRHDHQYETTPRSLMKRYQVSRKKIKAFRVKSKVQHQYIGRLKKQVADLTEIVRELRRPRAISEDGLECLQSIAESDVSQLLKRFIENHNSIRKGKNSIKRPFKSQRRNEEKGICRDKYPAALRSFAMTLHFYSPEAYAFVRRKFLMLFLM